MMFAARGDTLNDVLTLVVCCGWTKPNSDFDVQTL